jgi:pimeloyl-ACP methyl ester carboxylesterase
VPAAHAQPADAEGWTDGLAWALFAPEGRAQGGVVVLHGAGSCKENHFDFARACRAAGLAALVFDARGHGASEGPMDGRAVADVAAMTACLRAEAGVETVGLRGSSMGGYLAIVAAAPSGAAAVVAICPASSAGLREGLRAGRFDFDADVRALEAALGAHDEMAAAAMLEAPLLVLHAQGDEVVPVEHSRAIAALARRCRLIAMPGGHHRSIQHDPGLVAESVAFLQAELRPSC